MRKIPLHWNGINITLYIDGRYTEEEQKELMELLESYLLVEDFMNDSRVASILANQ